MSFLQTDSQPVSKQAADTLERIFAEYAMPQRPATGPMLVITGRGLPDGAPAMGAGCRPECFCGMGDVIEFIERPNEGHANLNGGPRLSQWLDERLAGAQPIDTCSEVGS